MPNNNQKPPVPNLVPGVGRLATDRYDFESHIEGTDFRQNASTIDMSPLITFDGYTPTNVQDAITALAHIVSPPTIVEATTTVPGIVQLSPIGDLAGRGFDMRVVKLQGIPVAATVPNNGDVLFYNASHLNWEPSGNTFAFVAGNDLSGTNTLQSVVGLSGNTHSPPQVKVGATSLIWNAGVVTSRTNPNVGQDQTTGAGNDIYIVAQNSTGSIGGDTIISGGAGSTSANAGGAFITLGDNSNIFQAGYANGGRIAALFAQAPLTSNLPSGTGDLVLYIANAGTVPTNSPSGGGLIYATGGQIWVKQADGLQFQIGSVPNPSIWGSTGGPYNTGAPPSVSNALEYTYRYSAQTTTNAPFTLNFSIPANTAVKMDAMVVGRTAVGGGNDSAQYNLSMGYVTDASSNVNPVGSFTSADPRNTAGASGWTAATISTPGAGGVVQVNTGFNTSTTINWTIIVQLVLTSG